MIGAKSLGVLALMALGLATAIGLGAMAPERLAARGYSDLFLVGGFGVLVGTMVWKLLDLGEPSRHYFRWATDATVWEGAERHFVGGSRLRVTIGENGGEAFDFRPRVQHLFCVTAALLLGVACLDARALTLLGRFAESVSRAGTYCPEESAAPVVIEDANAPGCALIKRAFALGYTESLGDCAPRQRKESNAPAPICTLRRRDEPLLHYSWRRLSQFWTSVSTAFDPRFKKSRGEFGKRFDHLGALAASQRQVLESAPHASHHIWTNLPDPGGAFRAETCGDRYRWLSHRPQAGADDLRASRVFEHVVAQSLFEARYEPAAAACRELHVHFGAAPDTCKRLAEEPLPILERADALGPVRATLARYHLSNELTPLGAHPPAVEPASFASFQCYFEGEEAGHQSYTFQLDGRSFDAEEVSVKRAAGDATLDSDRYDALARMLVRGFHYGALLSEAGLAELDAKGLESSFSSQDYLLSRLYGLGSVDLYLDPSWIATRPDLLEVYPYQRHLKNYVEMFRRQYRSARGRL